MPALTITLLEPGVTLQTLGALPDMLDANDPAPAREQFDRGYISTAFAVYQAGISAPTTSCTFPVTDLIGRLQKCRCETRESSFSKARSLRSSRLTAVAFRDATHIRCG
jgi:hypothetical protein